MPELFLPAHVFTDISNCHWTDFCRLAERFFTPLEHRCYISNLKLKAVLVSNNSKAISDELSTFMNTKIFESWSFWGLWIAYTRTWKAGKINSEGTWEISAEAAILLQIQKHKIQQSDREEKAAGL